MSAHEHRTGDPIHRRADQQATAGKNTPEWHQIRKSNGPRKRAANDERSSKSTDRSRAASMGEAEDAEEEVTPMSADELAKPEGVI